jgi:hypothetical protein
MAYTTPPLGTPGPAGDGDYIVVDGDCIESIAMERGYLWTTIWNHPSNFSLRSARVSQNVLLPGDRLHIPEKVPKVLDRPTDQKHTFVRLGLTSKLRLCVKQVGEPRANQPYVLMLDGKQFQGTTDADGWIDLVILANARNGRLTVGDDPRTSQVFTLDLGGMDPVTETTGIQKRLRNLGFACQPTGQMDDATAAAIALFQKGEDLDPTGQLDQQTIEKLKGRHGS